MWSCSWIINILNNILHANITFKSAEAQNPYRVMARSSSVYEKMFPSSAAVSRFFCYWKTNQSLISHKHQSYPFSMNQPNLNAKLCLIITQALAGTTKYSALALLEHGPESFNWLEFNILSHDVFFLLKYATFGVFNEIWLVLYSFKCWGKRDSEILLAATRRTRVNVSRLLTEKMPIYRFYTSM